MADFRASRVLLKDSFDEYLCSSNEVLHDTTVVSFIILFYQHPEFLCFKVSYGSLNSTFHS